MAGVGHCHGGGAYRVCLCTTGGACVGDGYYGGMLDIVRQQAAQRGLANVTVEYADADALPYADGRFHLVTCRIAAHHFGEVAPFLREVARVLRPGGLLALVDNVVPLGAAGDYVNAFEKLRDLSHGRCLSLAEWQQAIQVAGLVVTHAETLDKQMNFAPWAARHDAVMQRYLQAMLTEVRAEAAEFLRPSVAKDGITFYLREGILIGQKQSKIYPSDRPTTLE
ncbi:MAG: class I SAM-dependent methyltransferase [Anaerolineae bacterium]|nr:class I SAM-dependent methyltransferase [Anaerolineae bacterium]